MTNIAVIPARGGSKRIKRKNVREFNGRPMLAWAIRCAKETRMFEDIVVTSDDQEILDAAKSEGATVLIRREAGLSDDYTPTVPVIADAIRIYESNNNSTSNACCIYPCTPFLRTEDLKSSFERFRESKSAFLYPVGLYAHPTQRAMRMDKDGKMQFIYPEHELSRTQDLEELYHDLGQFYWGKTDAWLSGMKMHTDGVGYKMESWRFVDIDTLDDWRRAEVYQRMIGE